MATLLRFLGAGLVTMADRDGFVFTPVTTFAAPANMMSQSTREIHASFFHHSKPFQNQELLQRSRSLNSPHSLKPRPSHRPLDRHLWPSTPCCWDAGYFVLRSLTQVSPNACLPVFLDLLSLGSLCRTFPLPLPSSFPGALPCLAVSIQKQAVNLGALHFTPWCQLDSPIP